MKAAALAENYVGDLTIPCGDVELTADVEMPAEMSGLVIFVHGSGSGRHSPRNQAVARRLRESGLGTVLFDLLTPEEEHLELNSRHLRFDIPLLTERLIAVTDWISERAALHDIGTGYFGASTGAAAALIASTHFRDRIQAVVSRGGRPDLARGVLGNVSAPTLLVVGGNDTAVVGMNRRAATLLRCESDVAIVPGAGHLFEEPGALDKVARLSARWFARHLRKPAGL